MTFEVPTTVLLKDVPGGTALVLQNKCIAFIFSIGQPNLKIWPQMLRVILPVWPNVVGVIILALIWGGADPVPQT